MNKKLKINGQEASKLYNLRTTDFIYNTIAQEASAKKESVNVVINKILLKAIKQHLTPLTMTQQEMKCQ